MISNVTVYKQNGYLVKKNLISKKIIQKISNEIKKLKQIKNYKYFEYKKIKNTLTPIPTAKFE